MDQNNQQPVTAPTDPNQAGNGIPDSNGHKKVGPIIGTLVIVLILIIAALYIFASHINQQAIPTDTTAADSASPVETASSTQSVQPVTDTSDSVQSLQNDLNVSTQGVDNQNF